MPHLVTPHTARLALTYRHVTEPIRCELTFAVNDLSDGVFGEPATLANQFYADMTAALAPVLAPEVVFDGVVYEDVRSIPFGGTTYAQTDVPGTLSGGDAPIPTDTALAVSRYGALFGRSNRGRLYIPIWDRTALSGADEVDLATANDIVAALGSGQDAFLGDFGGAALGMISQQVGGVVRSEGLFVETVRWGITDNFVDSQRRRLLGRGR
jgi:hypothetical protein